MPPCGPANSITEGPCVLGGVFGVAWLVNVAIVTVSRAAEWLDGRLTGFIVYQEK